MATPARFKLELDATEFNKSMARLSKAMRRLGASIPRVHTLDAASPVYDNLLRDHLMRSRAKALLVEAESAPLVRRFYLRSVARKMQARTEGAGVTGNAA